ncbi:unnamed protein product, partial [Tilletia controversa]
MPAQAKTQEELEEELGPGFRVVGTCPPSVLCLACEEGTDTPMPLKHVARHIGSRKHMSNANLYQTTSLPVADHMESESQLDDSFLFSTNEDRAELSQFHNIMEMEDDVGGWIQEAGELAEEEADAAMEMGRDRSHLLQTLGGDAYPFESGE